MTRRAAQLGALALALAAGAACASDRLTSADAEPARIPVRVSATLTPDQQALVAGMSVEVAGDGMPVPVVAELDVAGAAVNGTVTVPAGAARRFTVRAFDAQGRETHDGAAVADVRAGVNATLHVTLYPRGGAGQPVDVAVSTLVLLVDPGTVALDVGGAATVTATVLDAGLEIPDGAVQWGAANPPVLEAVPQGARTARLAARATGLTTLVATYAGVTVTVPVTVSGGPTAPGRLRDVAAGRGFTCALDERGAAWCWGDNAHGQLGDGTFTDRGQPVAVGGGLRFASLGVGAMASHACALTARGEAWCWGHNGQRQLGNGQQSGDFRARNPTRVVGGLTWTQITAGWTTTCGIRADGSAWCWGDVAAGDIGLGLPGVPRLLQTPTLVTTGGPWASLSLGVTASCGVTQARALVCSTLEFLNPVSPVTTASAAGIAWQSLQVNEETWMPAFEGPGTVRAAMIDSAFACGITTARALLCWGHDGFGQVGNGAAAGVTLAPAAIAGPQDWDAVALGASFACALRGGAAWCWGRNDAGQLGDGTLVNRDAPTPVAGGHAFVQVTAGLSHACGRRADGAVLCWGANVRGELGDGSSGPRSTPVLVNPSAIP